MNLIYSKEGDFMSKKSNIEKEVKTISTKESLLNTLKEDAKSLLRKKNETYYRLGDTLNTIKALMDHSKFSDWLEKEIDFSHNLANKYMKIAANYSEEEAIKLGVRKAYSLLKLKKDERDKFLESHDVVSMTCAELDSILKQMKTCAVDEKSKVTRFIKNIDSFKKDLSSKISSFTQYKDNLDEQSIYLIKENQAIFDKLEELNELINSAKEDDSNNKSQVEQDFLVDNDLLIDFEL